MSRSTMVNGFDRATARLSPSEDALISRREAALGPAYRLFYETPVHLVRGEGVWLYDTDGKPWLDCYNNVASVGHCHPRVVEAMAQQAARLATHTRYLHEGVLDYAERLLGYFPAALSHVMFTCTGSEANDLGYRIARAATGGTGVIVTSNAYHGVTLATAQMSMSLGPAVAPGPEVFAVPAPTPANYPQGVAAGFAAAVRDACARMRETGIRPAMLIVDTIFSSDGVITGPEGFLKEATDAIRAEGGLFLADEVQPGFGRTGSHMWGFQRHGVVPDMVSMGKPMGNGYPVAALAMRPEVIADFGTKARYFNTFGGNPVAMAVAGAVLSVIEDEGLMDNARHTGAGFIEGLDDLARKHPALGERRGAGLFISVDILQDGEPSAAQATRIVNGLRDRRVLISASGARGDALKIRPPLPFRPEHSAQFLQALDEVLSR